MIFDHSDFPPLPEYSARSRAVYFEPILGSGERLTVGVVAQADQGGEYRVLQTVSDKTLQCMYGSRAAAVKNFVHWILSSANEHLAAGCDIAEWSPPFDGAYLGTLDRSRSASGMEGILVQNITLFASLYKGHLIDNALAEINGQEQSDDEDAEAKTASLIRQVKALYLATGRNGQPWQQEVAVKDNAKVCIDYLGPYYHANLSNFDVKHVKTAFNAAKAKLFDLEVLREKRAGEAIANRQTFELLIAMKQDADHEAQERYDALERLADSITLRVVKKHSPEEILERIIKMDKAA